MYALHEVKNYMGDEDRKTFIKDIKRLSAMKHPNIIAVTGVVIDPLAVIYEYVSFEYDSELDGHSPDANLYDLLRTLHNVSKVEEYHANFHIMQCIACDTASGLAFLHGQQVTHQNLNPNNVLVKKERYGRNTIVAKLSDFGQAKFSSAGATVNTGIRTFNMHENNLPFQAPEIILEKLQEKAVVEIYQTDTWAFGCITFCLLNPNMLYPYE